MPQDSQMAEVRLSSPAACTDTHTIIDTLLPFC